MLSTLNLKKATTEEWAAKNPILKIGDAGVDTTLNGIKLGDGKTKWVDLPWETQFFNTDLQQSKTPQIQLYKGYTSLKLAGLSDVNINELEDNHFIKYDAASGKWVNTALDSISNFKIDGSLIPDKNNTYDIGNVEKVWNNIYANNLVLGGVNYSSMLTDSIFSSANTWSAKNTFSADIDVNAIYTTRLKTKYDSSYGSHINHYYTDSNDSETLWLVDGYENGMTNLGLIPVVNNDVLGTTSYNWDSIFVTNVHFSTNNVIAEDPNSTGLYIGWKNSSSEGRYIRFAENEMVPVSPYTTLGTSSFYWKETYTSAVHLSSEVRLQTAANGQAGEFFWYNSDANASAAMQLVDSCVRAFSGSSGTIDLGNPYIKWRNIYGSGFLNFGNVNIAASSTIGSTKVCCFYDVTGNWVFFTGGIPNNAGGGFAPSADNKLALGQSGARWTAVFAAGGIIQTSDLDRKANIVPLESGLETINRIPIYSYTWKENIKNIVYGLIAQEVLEVAPELIDVPEDYKEGDGSLGVYTSNVLFLAVKAIQELSEKVSILENKLKNLGI